MTNRFGMLAGTVLLAMVCGACGGSNSASTSTSRPKLPTGVVDTPQPNQTISGKYTASGWAFADDGIKSVTVWVDLGYWMDCQYGTSRPDVNQSFSTLPANANVGWTVEMDTTTLPPGKHELVFAAESQKGAVRDLGVVPVTVAR